MKTEGRHGLWGPGTKNHQPLPWCLGFLPTPLLCPQPPDSGRIVVVIAFRVSSGTQLNESQTVRQSDQQVAGHLQSLSYWFGHLEPMNVYLKPV